MVCVLALRGPGAHGGPAGGQDDVIGTPQLYTAHESDTLVAVARAHDLGYVEIRAANPRVDPSRPRAGTMVLLPAQHILPDAPRRGIVVNLPELRLYYFPPSGPVRSFPIGIGRPGKDTPLGQTRITGKAVDPVWTPTQSERAENPALPKRVGPGPHNEMGHRALYLGWDEYAIHGTNRPDSIGRRDSHGCIRMYPEDIETLFGLVAVGTPVMVVNQPAKVGWLAGELYLQVHPAVADADAIAANGQPRAASVADADGMVMRAAGADADRLDWPAIHWTEGRRSGLATPVTRP
jgi:L,D-transpeptidase ErfK/SrfK